MIFNETNIEVRYLDVDSMKVVNNVKYFEYFEIARLDTFNKFFFPFKDLESKLNFYIPVIESHAKYLKFAEFQDILNVQTFIKQKPEWRLQFTF